MNLKLKKSTKILVLAMAIFCAVSLALFLIAALVLASFPLWRRMAAPARQAVREIAVAFEVLAPRLAPERLGDGASLDHHRRDRVALLRQLLHLALGVAPPLGHRHVGFPVHGFRSPRSPPGGRARPA